LAIPPISPLENCGDMLRSESALGRQWIPAKIVPAWFKRVSVRKSKHRTNTNYTSVEGQPTLNMEAHSIQFRVKRGEDMPNNLRIALICIAVGAIIGIPSAVLLPKLQPHWLKRYATRRSWMILLVGLILCAVMSAGHFVEGRPYVGGLFAAWGACVFFVLLISGLRFLSQK